MNDVQWLLLLKTNEAASHHRYFLTTMSDGNETSFELKKWSPIPSCLQTGLVLFQICHGCGTSIICRSGLAIWISISWLLKIPILAGVRSNSLRVNPLHPHPTVDGKIKILLFICRWMISKQHQLWLSHSQFTVPIVYIIPIVHQYPLYIPTFSWVPISIGHTMWGPANDS